MLAIPYSNYNIQDDRLLLWFAKIDLSIGIAFTVDLLSGEESQTKITQWS